MGEKVNRKGEPTVRAVTDGTGSGESKSTADSRTEKGRAGRGRAGSGRAGSTADGAEKEKKSTGLPTVDETEEEKKKREERNAKRRARYAEKKANKPKKVNTGKGKQNGVDQTQVEAVIMTISSLIAKNPKTVYWQLSDDEVTQLATPLTNIMSKSDALNTMSEHSDAIALVTACFTILLPRAIMTMQMMPKKEKKERRKANVGTDKRGTVSESRLDEKGENHVTGGDSVRPLANNDTDNGESQPYLGAPLSY